MSLALIQDWKPPIHEAPETRALKKTWRSLRDVREAMRGCKLLETPQKENMPQRSDGQTNRLAAKSGYRDVIDHLFQVVALRSFPLAVTITTSLESSQERNQLQVKTMTNMPAPRELTPDYTMFPRVPPMVSEGYFSPIDLTARCNRLPKPVLKKHRVQRLIRPSNKNVDAVPEPLSRRQGGFLSPQSLFTGAPEVTRYAQNGPHSFKLDKNYVRGCFHQVDRSLSAIDVETDLESKSAAVKDVEGSSLVKELLDIPSTSFPPSHFWSIDNENNDKMRSVDGPSSDGHMWVDSDSDASVRSTPFTDVEMSGMDTDEHRQGTTMSSAGERNDVPTTPGHPDNQRASTPLEDRMTWESLSETLDTPFDWADEAEDAHMSDAFSIESPPSLIMSEDEDMQENMSEDVDMLDVGEHAASFYSADYSPDLDSVLGRDLDATAQEAMSQDYHVQLMYGQVHHFNYEGRPLEFPSQTPPELSFAIICGNKKPACRRADDDWTMPDIVRGQAMNWVDPVVYNGPFFLPQSANLQDIVNVARGRTRRLYARGNWTQDNWEDDNMRPVYDTLNPYDYGPHDTIANGCIEEPYLIRRQDLANSVTPPARRFPTKDPTKIKPKHLETVPEKPSPLRQCWTINYDDDDSDDHDGAGANEQQQQPQPQSSDSDWMSVTEDEASGLQSQHQDQSEEQMQW
ncbi:hypothetical protein KEM55_003465, partial [Ascosphaera atra]